MDKLATKRGNGYPKPFDLLNIIQAKGIFDNFSSQNIARSNLR